MCYKSSQEGANVLKVIYLVSKGKDILFKASTNFQIFSPVQRYRVEVLEVETLFSKLVFILEKFRDFIKIKTENPPTRCRQILSFGGRELESWFLSQYP